MLPADVGAGSFTVNFIGLAGFALGSNMIAVCSNTTVYVGVTIFPCAVLSACVVGFEANRF